MAFDSVEDAWQFWIEYGARTGFNPRKLYTHKSTEDGLPSNAIFVCNKEGQRKEESGIETKKKERGETRTNCEVRFGIHRKPETFGKYRIYQLCLNHNHLLHTSDTVHMMPSQRHISKIQANEIELVDASGIRVKQSQLFMSKRAGGVECTGFIEIAWQTMLSEYSVQGNNWLLSIYKLKEKWASCYMKNVYSLGMRSTQLSESCNAKLKRHLKSSFSMIGFFRTFEDIVRSKNYTNLKLEYESREKLPMVSNHFSPFSLQLCNVYTPTIFKLFQNEISSAAAFRVTRHDEAIGQYALKSFINGDEATVSFSLESEDIICSCKKFESWGYLCRHAIRVLDLCFVFIIPSKYILSRWTKDAIIRQIEDNSGYDIRENIDMDVSERYRHLCPKLVRLADYAAQSKEGYDFILSQINGWMKDVKLKGGDHISQSSQCDSAPPTNYQGRDVRGLAKKTRNQKGSKRIKPWFEKQSNKKKVDKQPSTLQDIQYIKKGVVEMNQQQLPTSLQSTEVIYSESMMVAESTEATDITSIN